MAGIAGLSTLGIKFSYGVETTQGTKPTAFTELTRINSIGGLSMDVEQIDASALVDKVTRYIAGRSDTGGSLDVDVNVTADTIAEWNTLISAYQALGEGLAMWFQISHPQLEKAFFLSAQPPQAIPVPETGQNELWVVTFTLVVEDYKGMDTKVALESDSEG